MGGRPHSLGEVEDMSAVDKVVVYPVWEEAWVETRVTTLYYPITFIFKGKFTCRNRFGKPSCTNF